MTWRDCIHSLRKLLARPTLPTSEIEMHVAQVCDALSGDDGGGDRPEAARTHGGVVWNPPMLTFNIERHGATALGSSRAEVQEWTVDLEEQTKSVVVVGLRQLQPPQPRMNMMSVAEELASAILGGLPDPRLNWNGPGWVRLSMGKVLPAGSAVKEMLAARRKRLRTALAALLATAGWRMARADVFTIPRQPD